MKYRSTKKTTILCFAMAVFLVGTCFASASRSNPFVQAGKLAKDKLEEGAQTASLDQNKAYAIIGDDFAISADYFQLTAAEFVLSGCTEQEAQELARETLLEKYCLYAAAKKENCVASDEQVDQVIQETREGLLRASNKADFYDYLQGMGIEESEYWESQFENVKIYESIGLYKEMCFEKYMSQEDLRDTDRVGEEQDLWEAYWENIVDSAIKAQHIKTGEE